MVAKKRFLKMFNKIKINKADRGAEKSGLSAVRGFTLVEMMVSVSIFVIVAFIVVSTLLTMSAAYRKAQAMRLLLDNFNFVIQSMSLGIREGVNYRQGSLCSTADSCIQFLPIDAWMASPMGDPVCYDYISPTIYKCTACPCSDVNTRTQIVSGDIIVDKLQFDIFNLGVPNKKKLVKIRIGGKTGKTSKDLSSFFIQNSVSQRNKDVAIP